MVIALVLNGELLSNCKILLIGVTVVSPIPGDNVIGFLK